MSSATLHQTSSVLLVQVSWSVPAALQRSYTEARAAELILIEAGMQNPVFLYTTLRDGGHMPGFNFTHEENLHIDRGCDAAKRLDEYLLYHAKRK
ncbi:MAG: hypothetical protein HGA57_08735 [Chlorobium limicola]|uniref:hypothetical protein n=1 Tax=Chlorobium limicola TaxID=1092 RepID=UPI0023F47097|nr:hypothetical protein [Chlorobium limicola]NTV21451.1 hypothetical protein [Chlorobium limicola]